MSSNLSKKQIFVIDDEWINTAIMAIDSTEPTPDEHEAMQLAKLVPFIRTAMARGDSMEILRKKLKAKGLSLHYKKLKKLWDDAAVLSTKSDVSDASQGAGHECLEC